MLLEIALERKLSISAKPAGISALVALVLLIVLFLQRKTPSVRWASVIFIINTVAVTTALLSTNFEFALVAQNWDPFQATKLACLIAALLAPGFSVGLASILAYTFTALVQFEFFFPPELKTTVAAAEPWPILAFGLAGVLALVYRFRRAQLEQEVARIQAQNIAMRRLAHVFLNIRDLMNTPLQVIELAIDQLRRSNDANTTTIDRIDRSMQRLREINSVLVQYEKRIDWPSGS
jgi:hypothetical protein